MSSEKQGMSRKEVVVLSLVIPASALGTLVVNNWDYFFGDTENNRPLPQLECAYEVAVGIAHCTDQNGSVVTIQTRFDTLPFQNDNISAD